MNKKFYVVAQESGFGLEPLPTWTDEPGAVMPFDQSQFRATKRIDISEVPGAFQLLNVLSEAEADRMVSLADHLGFHQDSPVSLSHDVRHNENMNWVVSSSIDSVIWERSKSLMPEEIEGRRAIGLNARFRFYRYGIGDYFSFHTDGAWTGSRVIDGELIADEYAGSVSEFTYLIFLNDGYKGGCTQFMLSVANAVLPATKSDDVKIVSVRTPKGGVLCFPHGQHPQHCVHSGEPIESGTKYNIRSDVLFG